MPDAEGVSLIPLTGIGEVVPGTDLGALIAAAVGPPGRRAPSSATATSSW